jgi:hypothetical protein
MIHKPSRNAHLVKPAQTLQPRHINTHLKLLKTNSTLGRVDAILLRSPVGKHACASRAQRRRRCAVQARLGGSTTGRATVGAVGGDANVNVRLAQSLRVG